MPKESNKNEDSDPHAAELEALRARLAELEAESASIQEQRDYYELVHLMANILLQRRDIESMAEQLVNTACQIADTEHGYLFLLDRQAKSYIVNYRTGVFQKTVLPEADSPQFHGAMRVALESREMVVIHDYDNWEGRNKRYPNMVYALVCVPLIAVDSLIGVMGIAYETERYFNPQVLRRLQGFADTASLALDNVRLYSDLQEKERFILKMAQTIPEIMFVYDFNTGRSIYTNRPLGRILGYSEEKIREMGHDILNQLVHPDDRHTFVEAQQKLTAQDNDSEFVETQFRVRRADGKWAWIRTRDGVFMRDKGGQVLQVIGSARDITDERDMINQLQQSEERFRRIFESAPVGIAISDLKGIMLEVNPTLSTMLAHTEDELAGQYFTKCMVEEDISETLTLAQQLLRGEIDHFVLESQFVRKDTSLMWGRLTGSVIQINDVVHGIGILEDITKQKEATEKAMALNIERERVKLLADFVKDMSHDFRTPLSVISTSVHLLGRTDDPDQKTTRLARIQDQVDNLNRFVDSLLLMVRHDSERPMTMNVVEINVLVKDCIKRVESKAQSRRQTITQGETQDKLIMLGNADDLFAAIYHVLDNALTYAPEDSEVRVEVVHEYGEAVIHVIDHGIGIKESDLERIFERFYKADAAAESGGLGLGLAVSRRILERHGGSVKAESVYGDGSTFTIRLPLINQQK